MQVSGPTRYELEFDSERIVAVKNPAGGNTLSGPATSHVPKLYIVSSEGCLLYVGVTRQSLRTRLRLGFKEDGANGYHGYAWRRHLTKATLDVWVQESGDDLNNDIETVEAEVVYLIRQESGQWPEYQTEIHFHQSTSLHRAIARGILSHYRI